MVTKEQAESAQNHALNAIAELSSILYELENECSAEDFDTIKRGVGLSIGRIQMELLEALYDAYPELDHLKDGE